VLAAQHGKAGVVGVGVSKQRPLNAGQRGRLVIAPVKAAQNPVQPGNGERRAGPRVGVVSVTPPWKLERRTPPSRVSQSLTRRLSESAPSTMPPDAASVSLMGEEPEPSLKTTPNKEASC